MTAAALPSIDEIVENFEFLGEWDDRFAYLIDLGRKITPLNDWSPDDLADTNRVHGCQASVWLVMELGRSGAPVVRMRAISDAHIVNGLITILLTLYNGRTPAEVLATDVEAIVRSLGLEEHLSPTRRNGLHAMIARIRALAASADA